MSVIPIIQLSRNEFKNKDTILRVPSKKVVDFGKEFQIIVEDLLDTLNHHKIAIGLSAPQIGVSVQVSIINLNKEKAEPDFILVNPEILSTSGKKDKKKESCMSLPHYQGEVERRHNISISFKDRFGTPQTLNVMGFLARVIAHEIDHLQGILYVDRMENMSILESVDFFK